jgi:hypothetical protein
MLEKTKVNYVIRNRIYHTSVSGIYNSVRYKMFCMHLAPSWTDDTFTSADSKYLPSM